MFRISAIAFSEQAALFEKESLLCEDLHFHRGE